MKNPLPIIVWHGQFCNFCNLTSCQQARQYVFYYCKNIVPCNIVCAMRKCVWSCMCVYAYWLLKGLLLWWLYTHTQQCFLVPFWKTTHVHLFCIVVLLPMYTSQIDIVQTSSCLSKHDRMVGQWVIIFYYIFSFAHLLYAEMRNLVVIMAYM